MADQTRDPIKYLNDLTETERMDLLNFIRASTDPLATDETAYLRDVMMLKAMKVPERSS